MFKDFAKSSIHYIGTISDKKSFISMEARKLLDDFFRMAMNLFALYVIILFVDFFGFGALIKWTAGEVMGTDGFYSHLNILSTSWFFI